MYMSVWACRLGHVSFATITLPSARNSYIYIVRVKQGLPNQRVDSFFFEKPFSLSLNSLSLSKMAAASRRSSGPVLRTLSPAGRFRSSRPPPATTAFASSTSTFSARSTAFFQNRSGSPTRDSLYGSSSGSVPSTLLKVSHCLVY